jgi:parvulin-like peptidyl-prolyl isomerase
MEQRKARMAAAQQALREGVELMVYEENLDPAGDAERADSTPLARVGAETLTWGQINDKIIAAGKGAVLADPKAIEDEARRVALQREIDLRIMVQKARALGLEADPLYQRRLSEYRKSRLINLYRERLVRDIEPDDEALKAYYEANRDRLVLPETRKVQMVVVGTEAEAADLKGRIEAGEMTMFVAARDHSIAPNAKNDLGEIGWVNQGTALPALDEAIFSVGPGAIGGPVETPAGWHLVTVLDVKDAEYTDLGETSTRERARRHYIQERLDAYVVELRKNEFDVEVFEDRMVQLSQQEADMVKALSEKAQQPGSVTEERTKELQKYLPPQ